MTPEPIPALVIPDFRDSPLEVKIRRESLPPLLGDLSRRDIQDRVRAALLARSPLTVPEIITAIGVRVRVGHSADWRRIMATLKAIGAVEGPRREGGRGRPARTWWPSAVDRLHRFRAEMAPFADQIPSPSEWLAERHGDEDDEEANP